MPSRLTILLLCGLLAPAHGYGKRSPVASFYEDNPTYQDPSSDGGTWPTGTPESQGLDRNLLGEGTRALEKLPHPFSFLVLRHGVLVWEQYFHGSRATDSNNVHSASKSILSALIGIALREKYLSHVDQPIAEILSPKFKLSSAKRKLTLRNLLTMSAGIEWVEDDTEYEIETEPNWCQAILNLPQKSKAGTKFLYSTANTHLLSAILTEATGMSTRAFAEKYLFQSLGVTVEHWGRDPQGYHSGGYNLYLTPRELGRLGQLYLQKGTWKGESLVPEAWVTESWKPHQKKDSIHQYGYLWWQFKVGSQRVNKMWGYGGQFVFAVPDQDLLVVMTADTKDEFPEVDGNAFIAKYVLPALRPR